MISYYDLPEGTTFLVSLKALLRNREGKYLLLKSALLEANDKVQWGLPGGLLEKGETLAEGLRREVHEETGLSIEIGRPIANTFFERKFTFRDGRTMEATVVSLIYECETDGSAVQLSEEHTDYKWMTENEVCQLDFEQNVNLEKIIDYFKTLGFPKNENAD